MEGVSLAEGTQVGKVEEAKETQQADSETINTEPDPESEAEQKLNSSWSPSNSVPHTPPAIAWNATTRFRWDLLCCLQSC
ncbi:hypothetical protein HK100_004566 [Physocladia obscura]|uniref:Uncharacterized protein n=1 Tax=Physocladia obscura TaxID=109957 RepID=A0AAD5T8Q7_9FUNG|nr:hypothetical protein HK100_004566 [Physocladia obscura]